MIPICRNYKPAQIASIGKKLPRRQKNGRSQLLNMKMTMIYGIKKQLGVIYKNQLEESYDNVEDTTESLFCGTSYLEAALAGRSNTFYSTDDGNGNRVELRELSSR